METIKTVLSGAIGIRRKSAHEQAKLNPVHVVIAAVVFVALFIGTLVTIVRIVTR
jgi:Protein of unknown function (DUF2970)